MRGVISASAALAASAMLAWPVRTLREHVLERVRARLDRCPRGSFGVILLPAAAAAAATCEVGVVGADRGRGEGSSCSGCCRWRSCGLLVLLAGQQLDAVEGRWPGSCCPAGDADVRAAEEDRGGLARRSRSGSGIRRACPSWPASLPIAVPTSHRLAIIMPALPGRDDGGLLGVRLVVVLRARGARLEVVDVVLDALLGLGRVQRARPLVAVALDGDSPPRSR